MRRQYTEEFLLKVKDLAVIQLTPSQIAERLGLVGSDRRNFLIDINQKLHPLYAVYWTALKDGLADITDALHNAAVYGETDAIELALKIRKDTETEELKKALFNV